MLPSAPAKFTARNDRNRPFTRRGARSLVGAALNAAVPVIIDGSGAAAERPNAMIVATSPDGLAGMRRGGVTLAVGVLSMAGGADALPVSEEIMVRRPRRACF